MAEMTVKDIEYIVYANVDKLRRMANADTSMKAKEAHTTNYRQGYAAGLLDAYKSMGLITESERVDILDGLINWV